MFANVPECNKAIIARKLGTKLASAITAINKLEPDIAKITPGPSDVMRAFHTPFARVRAVLIAQDPYYTAGVADGLCFSTRGKSPQPSMVNINKCIANTCMQIPPTSLQTWADQGMLMLNCALTTRIGKPNFHADAWKEYTDAIISEISLLPQKVVFILLGEFAKKKQPLIDPRHVVLTWGHPSPMAKNNFSNCTVFKRLNEIIVADGGVPFVYGPAIETAEPVFSDEISEISSESNSTTTHANTTNDVLYAFTDGGATKNGGAGCVSSWGICVTDGKIVDGEFASSHIDGGVTVGVSEGKLDSESSNNRGELAAILHALEYISGLPKLPSRIIIASDSMYAMNAISVWADSWARDPKKLVSMKNLDLIYTANAFYRALKTKCTVEEVHVKGHRKETPGSPDWKLWKGNDICDKKCTEMLSGKN